jgi:hypothetical protein
MHVPTLAAKTKQCKITNYALEHIVMPQLDYFYK